MGAHLDEAAGGELADRLAHRRARHAKAACELGLIEAGAGDKQAAHDIVGERQAQFVRQSAAAATDDRGGRARSCGAFGDRHHAGPAGSSTSIMLT